MQEKTSSEKLTKEILSKKAIGNRFKTLRVEKGVSQYNMATILNISRSNYSQIERGSQYPTFETLTIFSDYYGKSYEWILHGDALGFNLDIQNQEAPINKNIQFPKINIADKKTITVLKNERLNYIKKSRNTTYINSLPLFEIPQLIVDHKAPIYRAFAAIESNRSLSICEDDLVIAKPINNYSEVIFNNIFVIINSSEILICRITDFIADSEVFICSDDDNDKNLSTIKLAEIKEVWMATGVYSIRSAPLVSKLTEQVTKFESVLNTLQDEIQQLKKLLKA